MTPSTHRASMSSGQTLIARAMGMAARRAGDTIKDNPFQDQLSGSAWLDGWLDARGDVPPVLQFVG